MTGFLRKTFGGKDAAQATKEAAAVSAQAQQEALDYLKETEALPQFYREQALGGLGAIYGLPGYENGEETESPGFDMSVIQENPLYKGIMGGKEAGEEAILRNAAATGGLRSGNVQSNLADFSADLEREATTAGYQDYVSGLRGLSGLPSLAPQISQQMAGIGATQAAGITGAAQAKQNALNAGFQTLAGLGSAAIMSDIRLKDNPVAIGEKNGLTVYRWTWNEEAAKHGLHGEEEGYMAHEVFDKYPHAVIEDGGYLKIDEGRING